MSRVPLDAALTRLGITPADAGAAGWNTAVLLAELGFGHALVPTLPYDAAADRPVRFLPLPFPSPLTVG
ncbi:hypothetical protein ACIRRA_26555 [Nocardia sp. NPDC101769]|uniref:hypothetical protein n=1 Tax=Nocardia sp. NPDC101769 TaxID=3364333 RepID=UPI0038138470